MTDNKKKFYSDNIQSLNEKEKILKKALKWLAVYRLLSFVLLFIAVFVVLPKNTLIGGFSTGVFIVLFLQLIKRYRSKTEAHEHTKLLIEINKTELDAQNHKFSSLYPGEEFIDHNHPYSYDMDLFGDGSLFQYLNRTVTIKGRNKLASLVGNENLDPISIHQRQVAIKELSQFNSLMHDFRAIGTANNDCLEDLEGLKKWVERPVFYLNSKIWLRIVNILLASTILSAVCAFFFPFAINILVFIFLGHFIITGFRIKHTSAEHALIGKRLEVLNKYHKLIACFENTDFKSDEITQIKKQLFSGQYSAASSIKKLSKIVAAFDARLNMVAAIFLEGFLLWDIRCMIKLEKWKVNQGHHLEGWINALSEFDALVSLATFAFNHNYTYPACSTETVINAKGCGHILIPPDQRVCNDFTIGQKGGFIIITGANMAGKSTFLRTIATNMVLAMTGAPVCASEFIFMPTKIFSSMRTSDSLNKNESYFYAELKRLKEILDRMHSGEDIFIVLDEILKGTNSIDKQKGSKALLEQIIKLNGTGVIATHDLELTKIQGAYPGKIKNMCFEIEIDQAAISFDYKIRQGVTTKMNASILMQQMGIII